jgi:hypothetical protein
VVFLSLQLFVRWKVCYLPENSYTLFLKGHLCLELYEEHLIHPEVMGEPQAGVYVFVLIPLATPSGTTPLMPGKWSQLLWWLWTSSS